MHGSLPLWLRVGQNSKEISFLNYVALKALGFIKYTNLEFLKLSDEGEGMVGNLCSSRSLVSIRCNVLDQPHHLNQKFVE